MADALSRSTTPLNGRWQVHPSDVPDPPGHWESDIPVPGLVDLALPAYEWKKFRYHWYRKTFECPRSSELAFLVIEQAMFGTQVWFNGNPLGGDIACYTSQEYDARAWLKPGAANEIIVRVGQKADLPPHSAVGADQERTEWIPGIWGDVWFIQCGNPRVKRVLVIPHIGDALAEARITLGNASPAAIACSLSTRVVEKHSGKTVGRTALTPVLLPPDSTTAVVVEHTLPGMHLWSPATPFLYAMETTVYIDGAATDTLRTVFGMREFRIEGRDFLLNGKKILLRGGNIAFHRFLSDADRGTLPWDLLWTRRLLIDIPKAHHFNFFRNHIGQMYNRWYDIADEHGMLIQNEWMFWTTTGSKEQITTEFTRWIEDNGNHPSIILWDALNECSDPVVQKDIVPALKLLDPSRPWESVDIVEEHPYIYSLGPVLNDRRFGFTRSLDEITRSPVPTMLNEFCWWWLDKNFEPSLLTREVVTRWLGPEWTREELIERQSFLIQELVELFRRMNVNAIQPFVYLSNNAGPTSHWFAGDIRTLTPKPVMQALRNAFAPFGVSIELWDRHFETGEDRTVKVFVFNDHAWRTSGVVSCTVVNEHGVNVSGIARDVTLDPCACEVVPILVPFPPMPGRYAVRAELHDEIGLAAFSEKEAHVFSPPVLRPELRGRSVAVLSGTDELSSFLAGAGIATVDFPSADFLSCAAVIVAEGMVRTPAYRTREGALEPFVRLGGTLLIIEPEFGVEGEERVSLVPGIELEIKRRLDPDKGGYDSYVFPCDGAHPVWQDIAPAHLRMFNGGYGGEIVSEHAVNPTVSYIPLARCGLQLAVLAACEIPAGKGRIIVSRLQVRGRLVSGLQPEALYARRRDPVLQRYLLNVLSYAVQDTDDRERTP